MCLIRVIVFIRLSFITFPFQQYFTENAERFPANPQPANLQTLITWEPCKWQCLIYLISFLLFSFHYLSLVSKEVRVLNFNCFFCFPKGPLIDNKFAAPTWLQTLVVRQAVFLQKGTSPRLFLRFRVHSSCSC